MHVFGTVDVGWAAVVRCLSFIDGGVVDSSFAMLPPVPPLWNLPDLVNDAVRWEWSMCCHATRVNVLTSRHFLRCRLVIR